MEVAAQSVPRIYEPNATEDQTVLIMEGDTRIGAKITQVRTMIGELINGHIRTGTNFALLNNFPTTDFISESNTTEVRRELRCPPPA